MKEDAIISESDLCTRCIFYLSGLRCCAFPDGIPDDILSGKNDHSEVLPGQDIPVVFTPLPETKAEKK